MNFRALQAIICSSSFTPYVFVCFFVIAGCTPHPAGKHFDLSQMMLGFGFGTQRVEVARSLEARGYSTDSTTSSIRLKNAMTIYGRPTTVSLSFSLERLRFITFTLAQGEAGARGFLDSFYQEISTKMGKPTTLLGSPETELGYIAQWFIPADTCGYIIRNSVAERAFEIFASGKGMKYLIDSALREIKELQDDPEYRRELERRRKH